LSSALPKGLITGKIYPPVIAAVGFLIAKSGIKIPINYIQLGYTLIL